MLSRSVRAGDFALYKYILMKIANLFFVFIQPNYARWLVKYHNNLLTIDETHPEIAEAMEKGYLGIIIIIIIIMSLLILNQIYKQTYMLVLYIICLIQDQKVRVQNTCKCSDLPPEPKI